MMLVMSDVTQILSAIDQGDAQAAAKLLPLVYEELAQEKPGQKLEATALVHEATCDFSAAGRTIPIPERCQAHPAMTILLGEFRESHATARRRFGMRRRWSIG